ncbi:DUF736 family protein [Bradyrhizobium sp. BWC-3-1]|uniref:DUF736 family protein n=1 Tax=Bradyrhizobium sp. BWC-3-1 TaxID=3080012 RepID=UPI00293E40CD|nr:DUF736 family protein [Bradyrhizobium sp. BWC-3-1]WOH57639.1 DUF736 family protein [Bradyrhizobium sp. BWC-3-1]
MVAGLKHARRNDVANIVRRSATISSARSSPWGWQAVRIFGKGQLSSENGPSRRFYMGRRRSRLPGRSARREGPDYLSLKLDDPSFIAPIYADLFDEVVEDATCSGYGRGRTVSGRLAAPHELTGRGCSAAAELYCGRCIGTVCLSLSKPPHLRSYPCSETGRTRNPRFRLIAR